MGTKFLALVEVTEDLATGVLSSSLLVVHDTVRGCEDELAKLTRGHQVVEPLLHGAQSHVEARRDNTALVEATEKVDHDLAVAAVVHDFELTNVAVLLHDLEEFHHDLGARADENLAFA